MTPLEAMAREIYETFRPDLEWSSANDADRMLCFAMARAALNALADNVDAIMESAFDDALLKHDTPIGCIAAAIRAAGETP